MSTCGTGEDIYFCYQAKKAGAKVYMDTATKLGHVGNPRLIDEAYVDEYRKQDETFGKRHAQDYVYRTGGRNGILEPKLVVGDR
jgi:hypothetical protein